MADGAAGQAANLLGALALAVADRLEETLGAAVGHSQSAAAMLSALDQFLEAPSVERIAQVVGLTPSGAVRLVDRLQREGYVRRAPGPDARTVTVRLTGKGRAAARRVRERRGALLAELLAPLGDSDRRVLAELVGRLLTGMMREPGAVRWGCRLCDLAACGRPAGDCPVEREARRRYG